MSFSSRQRHYHQPRNYRQKVYWRHFFVLRWQRQRNSSAIRFFAVTMSTVSFLSLSAICKLLHRITHRYLTPQRLPNDDAFDWQHRYDSLASLCLTRGRIWPRYTLNNTVTIESHLVQRTARLSSTSSTFQLPSTVSLPLLCVQEAPIILLSVSAGSCASSSWSTMIYCYENKSLASIKLNKRVLSVFLS